MEQCKKRSWPKAVTKAFPDKESSATEEELVEQFISALDTRDLRLGVSQTSPKTLDEALQTAIKLETLFALEQAKTTKDVNMANEVDPVPERKTLTEVNATAEPPILARELMQRQNKLEALPAINAQRPGHKNNQRGGECFNCDQPGHFRRNFPQLRYQGNATRAGSYRK